MSRTSALEILAVPGLPMIKPGDDLAALIAEGFARGGIEPRAGDVLAVAQKVVSKAEGRSIDLATVVPSARAIAETTGARLFKPAREICCVLEHFTKSDTLNPPRVRAQPDVGKT